MTDRPLLVLGRPTVPAAKLAGPHPVAKVQRARPARQRERLHDDFERLEQHFKAKRLHVQGSADGGNVEEVLVLEASAEIEDLRRALAKIPGLEWLDEEELADLVPDDTFFVVDKDKVLPNRHFDGRLYVIAATAEAADRLLLLWKRWSRSEKMTRGFGPIAELFGLLRPGGLRKWGQADRIAESDLLEDWRACAEAQPNQCVRAEVELHWRDSKVRREGAMRRIEGLAQAVEGRLVGEWFEHEAVRYLGVVVELPARHVEALWTAAGRDVPLLQCSDVAFVRPARGMSASQRGVASQRGAAGATRLDSATASLPFGKATIAILDGVPIENHVALAGRIVVDDADNLASRYEASERVHGTAVASVVIHGDLNAPQAPLSGPLYVRSVLCPDDASPPGDEPRLEQSRTDKPLVAQVHQALAEMFPDARSDRPDTEEISVVAIALGVPAQPYVARLSAFARLLDDWAWRRNLLFIVSAGNHNRLPDSLTSDCTVVQEQLGSALLRAIANERRGRRLLAPAESTNALTVGAAHADKSSDKFHRDAVDPVPSSSLPNPVSAVGPGYRRAVKPDFLAPGGRLQLRRPLTASTPWAILKARAVPGVGVACPGAEGQLNAFCNDQGTTYATALTTHAAGRMLDMLQELRSEAPHERVALLRDVPDAVWLKTLLVHGAAWGEANEALDQAFAAEGDDWRRKRLKAELLGFGHADFLRAQSCLRHRVTALGGGVLEPGSAHEHTFPIPSELSGLKGARLVVTLSWIGPVSAAHNTHQCVDFSFDKPNSPLEYHGVDVDHSIAKRGTVQHAVYEGERARAVFDGAELKLRVTCREVVPKPTGPVPYAIAVTLEIAPDAPIDLYSRIRDLIYVRTPIAIKPS